MSKFWKNLGDRFVAAEGLVSETLNTVVKPAHKQPVKKDEYKPKVTENSKKEQEIPKNDATAQTNRLLTIIVVLLAIGVLFNIMTYFNMIDFNDYTKRAFDAFYDRMGRMRLY